MANLRSYLIKELIDFDDESNPTSSSYDMIWPISVLDAIIDQNTPGRDTLRQILDRIFMQLDEGPPELKIDFPVRSVRGIVDKDAPMRPEFLGDVVLTPDSLGLDKLQNTSDMEKPVSTPQQNWVNDLITNVISIYRLTELPGLISSFNLHATDYTNPHRVSFAQINSDSSVTNLINSIVSTHNSGTASHTDIRTLITNLTNSVNSNNSSLQTTISDINTKLVAHIAHGGNNHINFFDAKENKINKSEEIVSIYTIGPGRPRIDDDHLHYPSSLGMINYVEDRLLNMPLPDIHDLPGLSDLINTLIDIHNEAADAHPGIIDLIMTRTKMDTRDFIYGNNGWRLVDAVVRNIQFQVIALPGQGLYQLVHYINGTVMSPPIITLGEMAFKTQLDDLSVQTRHIANGAVTNGKLANMPSGTVKGRLPNAVPSPGPVMDISMTELGNAIADMIDLTDYLHKIRDEISRDEIDELIWGPGGTGEPREPYDMTDYLHRYNDALTDIDIDNIFTALGL